MRIVDRKTFLGLPAGTLYAKYEPCAFESLDIKGDSLENDWFYQPIVDSLRAKDSGEWASLLFQSQETGTELSMNLRMESRDGCFEDAQLFAVWSKADVAQLIERLKECL